MIQQKIDTFKGLGDPGFDKPVNYKYNLLRADNTLRLMRQWGVTPGSILDVAGPSEVGKYLYR
jgi:hypothetical protein